MNDTQAFLTPEKFAELKAELEQLKTVRRKEVAESLEYARSLGDLSENAEYQEARDMQAAIEERISHLEKIIKEAKIVAHDKKGDVVGLGTEVTIQKDKESTSHTYTIVGSEEDIQSAQGAINTDTKGRALLPAFCISLHFHHFSLLCLYYVLG
jgi:transcription elongation factor GreA